VKDLPFLMGQKLYMGSETLNENDCIRDAIKNGTLGMGFIGLAESLTAGFISSDYKDIVAFLILISVLVVKPQGLFSKNYIEKV
jgi:hypothetical protein